MAKEMPQDFCCGFLELFLLNGFKAEKTNFLEVLLHPNLDMTARASGDGGEIQTNGPMMTLYGP